MAQDKKNLKVTINVGVPAFGFFYTIYNKILWKIQELAQVVKNY